MGSLPQNASELRVLLDQINRMDPTIFHADPAEAKEAAYAAQKLVMRAQAPLDVTTMLGWQEPSRVSAVKIAIDAGWFSVISRRGGAATVSDIAAATDADPRLVDRVMRVLASFGLLDELGVGMFGATAFSEYVQTPTGASGIEYWFDIGTHSFLTLPEYLAKTKYQDVRGAENWKIAKNTDLGIWDWLVAHPEALKSLDNHMASMTPDFGGWVEVYPVERILEAVDLGGPLLVDVGGGMGQDAERFLQKAARPFASGRIIVQDQEAVIAKADPDPSITMRAHDFFQAQPVQGEISPAAFYRAVLTCQQAREPTSCKRHFSPNHQLSQPNS